MVGSEEKSISSTQCLEGIRAAFLATVPVMAGYIFLGIGYGILFRMKGYGPLWVLLSSGAIYAGSLQYVLLDLIGSGASLLTAAATSLAVNARHLFYGISMIEPYKGQKRKPYLIFALTDETYSLVCTEKARRKNRDTGNYYFFVSLFDQIWWVSGGLIGNVLGGHLPFNAQGIDFALTAMFVAILADQWQNAKDHTAALVGLGSSFVCLLVFGSSRFLIPAMILISALLILLRHKEGITNERPD